VELTLLADVDDPRCVQSLDVMRDSRLRELESLAHAGTSQLPGCSNLAQHLVPSRIGECFGNFDERGIEHTGFLHLFEAEQACVVRLSKVTGLRRVATTERRNFHILRAYLHFQPHLPYTLALMDTPQLKKAGLLILGLGVLAIGLYFWTDSKIHLYIGIGAAALGGVLTAMAFLKK